MWKRAPTAPWGQQPRRLQGNDDQPTKKSRNVCVAKRSDDSLTLFSGKQRRQAGCQGEETENLRSFGTFCRNAECATERTFQNGVAFRDEILATAPAAAAASSLPVSRVALPLTPCRILQQQQGQQPQQQRQRLVLLPRRGHRQTYLSSTFVIAVLHLALGLLIAARFETVQGNTGGSGGGGFTGEWQHPGSRPRPTVDWSDDGRNAARRDKGVVEGRRDDYSSRRAGGGAGVGRERGEAEGFPGGWSERKRSDSMREIIKLAKADAKAVRAAAEDAKAAKAATAEAEAAWAAAGVGSGGGGGDNAMLFLECEVNGRPLRAFVDTGAQVTVMSQACAERCGLTSRIDARFAGRAVGVGFARILGRIHDANIRIGNSFLTCSFTVIEHGEIDLLVGLDVLRAHRCDISLSKNRMRFHSEGRAKEVAFLTRVERDGRRRRMKPKRPDSSDSEHSARPSPPSPLYGGAQNGDETPPAPLPPRVLREMARGTRGDGTPLKAQRRNSRERFGKTGAGGYDVTVGPQKMRGWPPRGGEELEEVKGDVPKGRGLSGKKRASWREGSRAY